MRIEDYLNPVDFRGRDVSFFKESEYPSSECKSVIVSFSFKEKEKRYFESAAPITEIDLRILFFSGDDLL